MKAVRLFECHEQSWLPTFLRYAITDYLKQFLTHYCIYQSAVALLAELIEKTGKNKLLDFCSGSGGMLAEIQQQLLVNHQLSVTVELTDIFPPTHQVKKLNSENKLTYHAEPIDVLQYKKSSNAIHTLFTSFHHFNKQEAISILKNVVASGDPIAIFEFTEHRWYRYLFDLMVPINVLDLSLKMFKQKPLPKCRLFFTYIFPVIPLLVWWDANISNLRSFSMKQLASLVQAADAKHYHWQIGKVRAGLRFYQVTYLLGWPKQE